MNLLASLMRALGWPPPAVDVQKRRRLLRCVCEFCGKDVAVVKSSGKLWKHACAGGWHSSVPPDLRVEPARKDEDLRHSSLCNDFGCDGECPIRLADEADRETA